MINLDMIAVGFDGSDGSRDALRWAIDLADRVGAEVTVLHATGLVERASGRPAIPELERVVADLTAASGLDPSRVYWRQDDGDPCSVLLRSVDPPLQAGLLVVGSRGQGAHAGLLLGSTSHKLAERSSVPVVIVPSR